MDVNKLIADLEKIRDGGHGHAKVVLEEQGEGYFGDLDNVNTLMGGDEPTLTLLGERMENGLPDLWAVTITHKHGVDVELYRTEDGALDALFDWTEQYWDETDAGTVKPAKGEDYAEFRQAQIDTYFDAHPYEHFTLTRAAVHD